MEVGIALFAIFIVIYAAFGERLGKWSITMPMVFVLVGFLLGPGGTKLAPITPDAMGVERLTEFTLALILFADASTLSMRRVRGDALLPLRLLTAGMLLTILLGAIVTLVLFPQEGLAFAFLLAAILAPTDAALGLPIFNDTRVPARIRRALNVESGLNDGVATPFVTLFTAFAVASTASAAHDNWLLTAGLEIGIATAVGLAVGAGGGRFVKWCVRRGWTSASTLQIAVLGVGLTAYLGSLALHGNGFIAAFVGGLVFGSATRELPEESTMFVETLGSVLALCVWTIFGAVLVPLVIFDAFDWRPIVYAMLSLTVVRMIPVAIAMFGTRLRRETVLLMGWFGPRGLASVVFTLLALLKFASAGRSTDALVAIASWTILLSVFAHGLSAKPLAGLYARRLAKATGRLAEIEEGSQDDE